LGNSCRVLLPPSKTYCKRCEKTCLIILVYSITKMPLNLKKACEDTEKVGSPVAKGAAGAVGASAANSAIAAGKAALTAAPEVEAGAVAAAPEAEAVAVEAAPIVVAASPEIEEGVVIGAVCLA
jgi:hypothetical protein